MCGIVFAACIVPKGQELPSDFVKQVESLEELNQQRGPDYSSRHYISIDSTTDNRVHLFFYSSVLRLRGRDVTRQPLVLSSGDVLCFNGEIFGGVKIEDDSNDAAELAKRLTSTSEEELHTIFNKIEGPHALVYYRQAGQRIYYTRDPLGRRSLLRQAGIFQGCDSFIVTSVAQVGEDQPPFQEVPAETIWVIRLSGSKLERSCPDSLQSLYSVPISSIYPEQLARQLPRITSIFDNSTCPVKSLSEDLSKDHPLSEAVSAFLVALDTSVRTRVQAFTRDINTENDSQCISSKANIAILFSGGIDSTTIACLADRYVPKDEAIDLLNVAFENPRKLRQLDTRNRRQCRVNLTSSQADAFIDYMVPDRVSGIEEVEELRSLCPDRMWNFVEINVDFESAKAARPKLLTLMHPCNTNMDLSLALALYFASEGRGVIKSSDGVTYNYHSTARLLLNGLGSDELLGGYGRHRSAYFEGGWTSLAQELQTDLDRISTRNLGRDDRVVASHGKELRHPFLALNVLKTVASMPLNFKMEPSLATGVGDKLILRIAARRLGLVLASERKKRAMQFGSHSARMESGEHEKKGHGVLINY